MAKRPSASQAAYQKLMARQKEIFLWSSQERCLSWDESTYMPEHGNALRGEQKALLMARIHQLCSSEEVGEWLGSIKEKSLNESESAEVREIRRQYDRATKIPASLVEALAFATTQGRAAWIEAREKSNFKLFLPHLERIFELRRQEADALGFSDPYDALLDAYEPGGRSSEIKALFDQLEGPLTELTRKITQAKKQPNPGILTRKYPVPAQENLGRMVVEALGFDLKRGRIDVTTHPFCSGFYSDDVRITTRYDESFFQVALFGLMHETGHGLYEQGLSKNMGSVTSRAASYGMHESQSRLWENFVGRSPAFWEWLFPKAKTAFPGPLGDVSLEDFVFSLNRVAPSFIRVEADEVTYNLHIILRFEIERALLLGDLKPAEVPGAWNDRFQKMFGITPPNDAMGCLQDIHWSWGSIGYFPTYTLGNLYAAQIYEAAEKALGHLEKDFSKGKFSRLREWLHEEVHRHGQRWEAPQLCALVTKEPISVGPLLSYLEKKFTRLYQIN